MHKAGGNRQEVPAEDSLPVLAGLERLIEKKIIRSTTPINLALSDSYVLMKTSAHDVLVSYLRPMESGDPEIPGSV